MLSRKFVTQAIVCLCFALVHPAHAAIDGAFGSESSGTVIILMSSKDLIKISNLNDIILVRNNAGDFNGGTDACIYRNATGAYTVRAYSSRGTGEFLIDDGGANALKYAVTYNDGTGAVALKAGVALTNRLNANTRSPRCTSGNNAAISVNISAQQVDSKPAGNYVGGLTVVVSPE